MPAAAALGITMSCGTDQYSASKDKLRPRYPAFRRSGRGSVIYGKNKVTTGASNDHPDAPPTGPPP